MQEDNFSEKSSIKINFIHLNKQNEFLSDNFIINTDKHEYSIFLNHENIILSLKDASLKFFNDQKLKNEYFEINGLIFLKNNVATFFIN